MSSLRASCIYRSLTDAYLITDGGVVVLTFSVRAAGFQFSDRRRLRNGHAQEREPRHIYVKHAVRVQHSLQNTTAVHHRHEQGKRVGVSPKHCESLANGILTLQLSVERFVVF